MNWLRKLLLRPFEKISLENISVVTKHWKIEDFRHLFRYLVSKRKFSDAVFSKYWMLRRENEILREMIEMPEKDINYLIEINYMKERITNQRKTLEHLNKVVKRYRDKLEELGVHNP